MWRRKLTCGMRNLFSTLNDCHPFSFSFANAVLIVDDKVFRGKPYFADVGSSIKGTLHCCLASSK